jgi:hypothetical protein
MAGQWSIEKAWNWHQQQGWRVGCNFTPSMAINQLEMWQALRLRPRHHPAIITTPVT